MRSLVLLSFLTVSLASGAVVSDESVGKVVCYFGSWAVWRPNDGQFDVDDIDPFLCTHLIFGFAGLSNHTWEVEVLDPWNELCPDEEGGHNCAYDRFVALKDKNPALTILLAVGGWREGSEDYSVMSGSAEKRRSFIDSTIDLIRKHGFDGLDLDWEYPAARGGVPEDKENFVTLIHEMREAFDQYNPPLFLSTAMAAGKPVIDAAYDIKPLVDDFDQFHIMSYDYHGAWENRTHHNAPLCGYYSDTGLDRYYNVMFTINYYLDLGIPRDKLLLGIPTYGRCWTLDSLDDTGMLAPASAPGPPGPYIKIPGTLGFNEICKRYQEMECHIKRDPNMYEPYFYCPSDRIWCGFDDEDSVFVKAHYARNMGLAGFLVWTIDTDDFHPRCYDEPFHLVKSMKRGFNTPPDDIFPNCTYSLSTTPETTTTPTTTTTTTTPTTTTPTTTTTTPTTTTPTTTTTTTPTTTTTTPTTTTTTPTTTTPTTTTVPTTTTTTTPTTTTTVPTTTTTPTPTTTTVPTTTTTTTTTPTTTTTRRPVSTPHPPHPRPDCSNSQDGTVYPHKDCNKFWECVNGQAIIQLCGPGTLFDEDLKLCNWENQVDTSQCTLWVCEVDNTYLPHADCNKYYRCYSGSPHLEECADGLYWNQSLTMCDIPANVDTSDCNPV